MKVQSSACKVSIREGMPSAGSILRNAGMKFHTGAAVGKQKICSSYGRMHALDVLSV